MKGLDLSRFKKMSSDKNCTTLHHPDGHSIRIAHKRVDPKMLKELEKLPIHKASGGEVQQYAEGTPDEPISEAAGKGINININAQPQPSVPVDLNPQPPQPQAAPVAVQQPIKSIFTPPEPSPESLGYQNQDRTINYGDQTPPPQPQGPVGPQKMPEESPPTLAPEQNNEPGQQEVYQPVIDQRPPQSQKPIIAAPEPEQIGKDPVQQPVDVKQELSAEDKAWEHDLNNGHITPETYSDLFAKKSTLGKIGTIFGLLVGGAGAGLTKTENPLLTMMNNEIQNDLEAQKQSKGNAQNFIKLNQSHHMNQAQIHKLVQEGKLTLAQADAVSAEAKMKAYTLANMQMNRAVLHKLTSEMQRLPVGSEQRVQAEQNLAMMYQAVNNENFNLADRAAVNSGYFKMLFGQPGASGSDEQEFQKRTAGMRMLGPQGESRAKDIEEKHFPGLKGQASVPLSGGDREALNSGIQFDQKLGRFMEWTKNHSGDLSPTDRKTGQALAAELQGAYRQATNGGVYKEGEQNFISKLIDSTPTKFFNDIRVMPSLKAISGENKARIDQLAKSKGFHGYQSGQEQGSKQTSARADYKMINGIKYVRGPDGKAVAMGSNDKSVARK